MRYRFWIPESKEELRDEAMGTSEPLSAGSWLFAGGGTGGLRGWIAAWIYCTGLFHGDNRGRAGCVGADDRT